MTGRGPAVQPENAWRNPGAVSPGNARGGDPAGALCPACVTPEPATCPLCRAGTGGRALVWDSAQSSHPAEGRALSWV